MSETTAPRPAPGPSDGKAPGPSDDKAPGPSDDKAPGPSDDKAPKVTTVSFDEFQKVELRVAEILEARPHQKADRLLVLQLKVGERTKQIVAGIREHREVESLIGKKIVIVDNLEPVKLRGETSEGMLLAASDEDGLALITPDINIATGTRIS